MIETIAIIYGIYLLLGIAIKPSIRAYYEKRYGEKWEKLFANSQVSLDPHDWALFVLLIPAILPILGIWDLCEKVIHPILQYPGKKLAENLMGEAKRNVLPPHVKDEIEEEAEKEVEEFLQNP